jgi:nucleoside-diphosphate-sugar epimerase
VLLTGARGFLGRPVLARLLERGVEVHAVGRGAAPDGLPAGAIWEDVDLLVPGAGGALVRRVDPDAMLHLAWETTPGGYWTSPANRDWLAASRELAGALDGARMVTAGSCAEYSWQDGWCSEARTPLEPATLYGRCKRELGELSSAHGRLFFLYGPHEARARLVPSLCARLLAGERAPTTSGRQKRDFLHVDDAAEALVSLLFAEHVRGAVNIASGEPIAVAEVIEMVARYVGRPELVGWGEVGLGDHEPPLLGADVRRLREELGFAQRVPMAEGLAATVEWWRRALGAP